MAKKTSEKSKSTKTKKASEKKASLKKTVISKKKLSKNTASKTKKSEPNKVKALKISKDKKKEKLTKKDTEQFLLNTIIEGMQEKKAKNITVIDLKDIENSFCNYFVICEAESKPQLQAITESIEEMTRKKLSVKPHHIEGLQNAEWILIDYLTIVAHVFRSDIREFYKLESLWADAKVQYV